MLLHNFKNEFQEAITATAQKLGIREVFIEKDYWITFVLNNLSNTSHRDKIVFKGGTALSKAFKIIKRFSEDVDLAFIGGELTDNQIKKNIRKVEKDLVQSKLNEFINHPLTSKGSRFRKVAYKYPRLNQPNESDYILDCLIIEINSFTSPVHYSKKPIISFIGEYLGGFNKELVDKYSLDNFEVNVLDIERTFTEKIMALIRASYDENDPLDKLRRKIRHIYDISMLMNEKIIQDFLESENFIKMIDLIKKDDESNQEFQGEWLSKDFSKAMIFDQCKETMAKLSSYYHGEFTSLLYDSSELPKSTLIENQFRKIKRKLAI